MGRIYDCFFCHARLYAGHPRLSWLPFTKTWMAGTSPAMTRVSHVFPVQLAAQESTDIHRSDGYISFPGEWIELDIRDLVAADM
ncbi:MAG: hypothetical protein AB7F72_06530 [Afipia sp.]